MTPDITDELLRAVIVPVPVRSRIRYERTTAERYGTAAITVIWCAAVVAVAAWCGG